MPFKYTLMCDTLPWSGYNVLEMPDIVLQAANDAGYDGVDLPADPTKMDGRQWRERAEKYGLEVPELLGAWGFYHAGEERNLASPDNDKRQHAVNYAKSAVDLASEVGARFIELCASQPAIPELPFPRQSIKTLRQCFRESIKEICEHAAQRDVTIVLEPLNCYEGIPGVLTTVYEAINYVDELGLENLGIQPDVYHMNIEEGSVSDAIRAAGNRIKHFHMNETNHCGFGMGHADFKEIFRILKGIGYQGYLATYMPRMTQEVADSAPGEMYHGGQRSHEVDESARPDLVSILKRTLSFLKGMEQAVDLSREFYEADTVRY